MTIEFKVANDSNYFDPENTMTEQEYNDFVDSFIYNLKNTISENYNDATDDFEVLVEKGANPVHQVSVYDVPEDYFEDEDTIVGECKRIANEVFASMEY